MFGEKSDFAIEIIIKNLPGDVRVFGYVNCYINNELIGYYRSFDMLCDAMNGFNSVDCMKGMRIYEELFRIHKDDLFAVLWFSCVYHPPESFIPMIEYFFPRTNDVDIYDDRVPMDFSILPDVDSFRGWRGYLVSAGEFDKIVYGYYPDIIGYDKDGNKVFLKEEYSSKIRIIILRRGVVDGVIRNALDYYYWHESMRKRFFYGE